MEIRAIGTSGNAHHIRASVVAYIAISNAFWERATPQELAARDEARSKPGFAFTAYSFLQLPIIEDDSLEDDVVEICDREELTLIRITDISEALKT